jgi:hypothetical protein
MTVEIMLGVELEVADEAVSAAELAEALRDVLRYSTATEAISEALFHKYGRDVDLSRWWVAEPRRDGQ